MKNRPSSKVLNLLDMMLDAIAVMEEMANNDVEDVYDKYRRKYIHYRSKLEKYIKKLEDLHGIQQ